MYNSLVRSQAAFNVCCNCRHYSFPVLCCTVSSPSRVYTVSSTPEVCVLGQVQAFVTTLRQWCSGSTPWWGWEAGILQAFISWLWHPKCLCCDVAFCFPLKWDQRRLQCGDDALTGQSSSECFPSVFFMKNLLEGFCCNHASSDPDISLESSFPEVNLGGKSWWGVRTS